MKFTLVSLEFQGAKDIHPFSALLINKDYVIFPLYTISSLLTEPLHLNEGIKVLKIDKLVNKQIILKIKSANFNKSLDITNIPLLAALTHKSNVTLSDWKFVENKEIEEFLFSFVVIGLNIHTSTISKLECILMRWLELIKNDKLKMGDEICIKSVAFGSIALIGSFSKGIVSNVLGNGIIFSDCPTTPGSEGSLVYKVNRNDSIPQGLVLSPLCWWRGVWTGMTLLIDVSSLLFNCIYLKKYDSDRETEENQKIFDLVSSSIFQLYTHVSWGTAILINKEYGILLTNSHVISSTKNRYVKLYFKERTFEGEVIYCTPSNGIYDLAVIKCDSKLLNSSKFKSIEICLHSPNIGDTVYTAGFALFSKYHHLSPSFTKGHVSQIFPSMIRTTCCINPGMSGGAVVNHKGQLLAIMVCNVRLENNVYYPRFNMAIPFNAIKEILQEYMHSSNIQVLSKLYTRNKEDIEPWINFTIKSKL